MNYVRELQRILIWATVTVSFVLTALSMWPLGRFVTLVNNTYGWMVIENLGLNIDRDSVLTTFMTALLLTWPSLFAHSRGRAIIVDGMVLLAVITGSMIENQGITDIPVFQGVRLLECITLLPMFLAIAGMYFLQKRLQKNREVATILSGVALGSGMVLIMYIPFFAARLFQ